MTTSALRSEIQPAATDSSATRRSELASFLRSRRERIRPRKSVSRPVVAAERLVCVARVAQLAGVGVTWFTWLEQGRDINVSEQVLDAIARTLRLDRTERRHLYTLAGVPLVPGKFDCSALTPNTQRILDQLSPYPATVVNKRYDVLAYNDAYRKVLVDLDRVPVDERNIVWLAFTYPDWTCSFVDEGDMHSTLVGGLRASMAEHVGEPAWRELVDRLISMSPEFAELWERHDVIGPGTRIKLVEHPVHGLLKLESTNLWVGQNSAARVSVYLPSDEASERKLQDIVHG